MNKLFALDLGNKQTKIKSEKGEYVAPSALLNAHEIESPYSSGSPRGVDKFQISTEDDVFYWGKGVIDYSADQLTDTLGFEGRYDRPEYKRLAAMAIAFLAKDYPEAQEGVLSADIVVGLPTSDYTQPQNISTVIKAIKRQQVVIVDDKPITLKIESVRVLPQPIGTVYNYLLNEEGEAKVSSIGERYAVADIGGGTVLLDQILTEQSGFRFDNSNRTQSELGMNELYTRIEQKIAEKYGINADINIISKALRTSENGKYVYKQSSNNILDITNIVEQEINYYTQRLIEKINTTFKNLSSVDVLLFTGGGTAVINKKLVNEQIKGTKIIYSDDPEKSNVNGFYKFGLLNK
ncbi:ParM/StbA family protein [Liquorilactobacillus hordei]|uniref:ParM/StbA family protein n=1 Tax=Liquorilactobacillus hordei TaxID=468911 RepID=UPI001CC10728|nr:ParM/StbA family protein [Liquorilactobacillus hordei]